MATGKEARSILKRLRRIEEAQGRLAEIATRVRAQADTVSELVTLAQAWVREQSAPASAVTRPGNPAKPATAKRSTAKRSTSRPTTAKRSTAKPAAAKRATGGAKRASPAGGRATTRRTGPATPR
jgi:hypothetical protein